MAVKLMVNKPPYLLVGTNTKEGQADLMKVGEDESQRSRGMCRIDSGGRKTLR